MKKIFKQCKVSYKKMFLGITIILSIINILLLIKFFLMHDNARLGVVLGGILSILEFLIACLSLANESGKNIKMPPALIKYKNIVLAIVAVVNILVMWFWLIPYTASPKIHTIDASYVSSEQGVSIYQVNVETTLSVDKIVVQANGIKKDEISYYSEHGGTRCFTTNIELSDKETIYKITAYILTINQEKILNKLEKKVDLSKTEATEPTEEIGTEEETESEAETEETIVTDQPTEEEKTTPPTGASPPPTEEPDLPKKEPDKEPETEVETESEEGTETDNSQTNKPSITVYYEKIPISITDLDAKIYTVTSKEATRVTVQAVRGTTVYELCEMKTKDYINWLFEANFYEEGLFDITVIAYFPDGQVVTECIQIQYPFY